MRLKILIRACHRALTLKYGKRLLPGHRKALDAILACRSQCGEFWTECDHGYAHDVFPLSCGHRSCPQCQHHLGHLWLERQRQKLLPVEYFMVTFTLPYELRDVAWKHQTLVYALLMRAAAEAIKTIGKNNYGLELAATVVLHTHKRDKGYHPHVHLVVPGGGVIRDGESVKWKVLGESFLINEFALARIFRGIFLHAFFALDLDLPYGLPKQWVAHIRAVGSGEKALKYLSRYLYRGVISEDDVFTDSNGQVIFHYKESKTRKDMSMKLSPEDFIWRLLKHVLPRGLRRVRDYGFLHSNAHLLLHRIQVLLKVSPNEEPPVKLPMCCRVCASPVRVIYVIPKRIPMQFRFYPVADTRSSPG